ncbi:hypothetical protein [Nocardia harenae]|nr:hypothetical protein [Nocardia harenae]
MQFGIFTVGGPQRVIEKTLSVRESFGDYRMIARTPGRRDAVTPA